MQFSLDSWQTWEKSKSFRKQDFETKKFQQKFPFQNRNKISFFQPKIWAGIWSKFYNILQFSRQIPDFVHKNLLMTVSNFRNSENSRARSYA